MDCSREPSNLAKFVDELIRAYQEYLGTPTLIIGGFTLLGIGMVVVEQAGLPEVDKLRQLLSVLIFGDAEAAREILISSAATLITITSITFTVLLLAVQQAAAAMSTQIIDQFLRRPINQVLFGYFVGMSIYTLIALAGVRPQFSPVLSTALAFIFAAIALYFLAALVYITLTQMRSTIVILAIHDEALRARRRQLPLLAATRRAPVLPPTNSEFVRSRGDGYVSNVILRLIEKALTPGSGDIEVVLRVRIGSYVAHGDTIAEIRGHGEVDTAKLGEAVLRAVKLSRTRDLLHDAANGVEQIMNIGWTSVSSAQHSPSAGAQAIHALRDLVAEWSSAEEPVRGETLPVVYNDRLAGLPLRAIESLGVAAVESRQHQSFAYVLHALVSMLGRVPHDLKTEAEGMVLRLLTGLQDQMLTTELDDMLHQLASDLEEGGHAKLAEAMRKAHGRQREEVARVAR